MISHFIGSETEIQRREMVSLGDSTKQGLDADLSVSKSDALLTSTSWEQGEGGFSRHRRT